MAFNMLEQVTRTSHPFLKPASTNCPARPGKDAAPFSHDLDVVDGDQKMVMGMIWTLILDSGVRKPLAIVGKFDQAYFEWSSMLL